MELYVKNWRCIEEARVSLRPVTVFIGGNSTGKSSLAYAAYFLAKISEPEWRDVNKVLAQLYGVSLDGVVRSDGARRFYPVIVEAGGARFEAQSPDNAATPNTKPWRDHYLLPSQRLSFLRLSQLIPKIREAMSKHPETRPFLALASSLFETLKTIPVMPPLYFFLEDLTKLYLGRGFVRRREMGIGTLVEEVMPLLSLIAYSYVDPFITKLQLPLDLAPDGFADSAIIEQFVDAAREDSLLVIEEPEIHKNPITTINLVKHIAARAVEKKLTVVMTTHSDIAIKALLKAVEDKSLETQHVAVYYFERSAENPWTRVRELRVYEDGTIEELPDVERVVSMLF
ncbi:AAA family ATPase [Pyrobaculum islandicum]|uniref:AAA family ATPase n=1 Tax=Pyrobaculum islandicum TaxID=2277 RepID=UPI001432E47C|nr:AAA family ATPase [Pyrobaculum islandicum]